MKNKLIDLNNHLFAQLERLGDEEISGEVLGNEIARSKAMSSVAKEIISNAALALEAEKWRLAGPASGKAPAMFGLEQDK